MGILGWSPDQFWGATMCDFAAAFEGYKVGQGDGSWAAADQRQTDEVRAKELRHALNRYIKETRQ